MIRIGVDIVELKRFQTMLETEDFLKSVFHQSELRDTRVEHLAGIFAAKEACFKALNKKLSWKDIEIVYTKRRPHINLPTELAHKVLEHDISIAHDGDYVVAIVAMILKRGLHENTTGRSAKPREKRR